MGKLRLKVVLRCTHCRARVRLDEPTAGELADNPELMIKCSHCEREFSAAGVAPPPADEPAPPAPVAAKPPFGDLVRETETPPPFSPLEAVEAPDQPARKPTLTERWNAIPPRRQRLYVGAAFLAMVVAVVAWPGSVPPHGSPVAAGEPLLPPQQSKTLDDLPPQQPRFVVAIEGVPLNTLVTKENVHKLFQAHDARTGPNKAVKSLGDVIGKYVVKELQAGQIVTEPVLAMTPFSVKIEPPPPPPALPSPPQSPPLPEMVVWVHGQLTSTEVTFTEVAPGRWVRKKERVFPTGQATPTVPTQRPPSLSLPFNLNALIPNPLG